MAEIAKKNISGKRIDAQTGDGAAAIAMKQINPDVASVYPITPQTQIMEDFAKYLADGKVDTEVINVESEHSAMSACVGAAASGVRTMTASSSQGLLLMGEILPIASGLRLPIVMNVVNRAISAPINIHGDHSDTMLLRDAGWIQLFSESPQEVYDNTLIAVKLAEKHNILLPVMVMQDGFITSHSFEKVEILDDDIVKDFIGEFSPKYSLLDVKNPITFGPLQLFDYYFETKYQQHKVSVEEIKKEFIKVCEEFEKISHRKYFFFEQYHSDDADFVIVCTSSTAGTVKEVVDRLRKQKIKAGLIKIRLYRPFPFDELRTALKNAKAVAVLDRAMSLGSVPPLYHDVSTAIQDMADKKIQSYVFGLGGRDIYERDIVAVYEDLMHGRFSEKDFEESVKFIGCRRE